ncbi:signal peptide peptidase SppA [Dysgonomonas sp. 216]|uniref:signal peptide peptidase SppA n=1 Tax=Dysgonomonas sp. 216 TaxID=2302934 RepID=UPI0013D521DB|nr:signal peptide peptidase SppA [Dysgonomonas sp. 216]NDW18425.1 signal peptide peptidase SppA [Dysgonomonas sp. 216]
MKSFFKGVLASVAGVFIAFLILVICFSIVVINSSSPRNYKLEDNTILSIRLSGILKDHAQPNPIMQYLGFSDVDEISQSDIVSAIKKAKENDKVKGIYIYSSYLSASNASLLEIRNELNDFRKSGKFIIAYADTYMQGCYFLSSVADKVILNPSGNLDLHGLASSRVFYKGLFDKLGVEVQVFKVGTYKSAVEPYMLDKMSPANREQVGSYIHDIWNTMLAGISQSRNISVSELDSIANMMPLFREPQMVVDKGLADTLMYETEVKDYLCALTDAEKPDDLKLVSVKQMASVKSEKKEHKEKVAVLYAEGSIVSGNAKTDINDRFVIKQLEKLKDDEDVKAVVLRVNSGGGSAYASEQIWKAVTDLKVKKPIVVSMGGYAASGGYYISCNASKIIAQPNTLTGSIGIFGLFPNVEGLAQKAGLTFDHVKTNRFADFGDLARPMREDEKVILQEYIDKGYDLFITRCAEGRGISKDSIAKIAEGRVWTGNQALKIGLVDAIGGIDMAIEEAAKFAELKEYSVSEYPKQKSFWENLTFDIRNTIAQETLKSYLGDDYRLIKTVREIKEMTEQDFIQARLPYDFEIK